MDMEIDSCIIPSIDECGMAELGNREIKNKCASLQNNELVTINCLQFKRSQ